MTLHWFYYNFSTMCMRDDLVFCSLIMFMIDEIYADQNIKSFLANHFNHVDKFVFLP